MKYLDFLRLYFDAGDGDNGGNDDGQKDQAQDKGAKGAQDKGGNNDDDRTRAKWSDDDVDRIVAKRIARLEKQKQKETDEATRLATMTAQERAEHERDELQKELNALKRANTIAEMEKEARKMLSGDGITVTDDLVSILVSEDAEGTSKAVKAFAKAFKSAVQTEVKKQLSHKKPTTGMAGTITKEDILKVKDPIKRQKLIKEHINLFK